KERIVDARQRVRALFWQAVMAWPCRGAARRHDTATILFAACRSGWGSSRNQGVTAMARLQGKVAIITGGSGGIGRHTAGVMLDEGASVVLVDRDQAALDEAAGALSGKGDVLAVQADVTREEDVQRYVSATVARFGRIDVFFNN